MVESSKPAKDFGKAAPTPRAPGPSQAGHRKREPKRSQSQLLPRRVVYKRSP